MGWGRMAESRALFVTCHSCQEEHTAPTCVCLEPGLPLQVCSSGAMARLSLPCHRGWAGTSPVLFPQSLIELGVAFRVSCHKQLILWRVLEGSEIHLERVREFSVSTINPLWIYQVPGEYSAIPSLII